MSIFCVKISLTCLCVVHFLGLFLPNLSRKIFFSLESVSFVFILGHIVTNGITILIPVEVNLIVELIIGLICGQALFLSGIIITLMRKKLVTDFFFPVKIIGEKDFVKTFGDHLITALYEEIVWRVGFIRLWQPSLLGVALSTFFFIIKHKESICTSKRVKWDFRIYSFLSSFIYFITQSYVLVVVLHTIRNVNIVYLERRISE